MIDLHNHILVGIDDGPSDIEQAVKLIQQAKSQGITGIVATPHHLHPRYRNQFQQVTTKLAELRQHPTIQQLEVTLFPGQEIRITDEILTGLEEGSIQGINKSKYLLIEFPTSEVPHYTKRLFFEIQTRGYVPIIAHPERNKAIAQHPELLYELVNQGALSQLTASSLTSGFGKKIQRLSLKMIDCHLSHLVASDAHHCIQRPFAMNTLFNHPKLASYSNAIHRLVSNATSVVNNQDIHLERPTPPGKVKTFFNWF